MWARTSTCALIALAVSCDSAAVGSVEDGNEARRGDFLLANAVRATPGEGGLKDVTGVEGELRQI